MPGIALVCVASLLLGASMERSPQGAEAERLYRAGKQAKSTVEKRRLFQGGVAAARRALAENPDDPAGLLWLVPNLAEEALTHSKIYALKVIPEVERTLLRLEATNPQYDHAAAARGLASLYYRAPAVISVGSSSKAAMYFGRALARAPEFPGNQALAAEFYADKGDCARATALARQVLARPNLEKEFTDGAEWRRLAQEALEECE
jgi:hypothetical protein